MYFRRKTSAGRAYLQIVASRRIGDQVRQQVIATLGRYEDLQASGQLERLTVRGAVRRQGDGAERGGQPCRAQDRSSADRTSHGLRTTVGGDRLPQRHR